MLTEFIDRPAGNAYSGGYNACLEQLPKSYNPYKVNSKEYRCWLAGYYGAEHESLRKF